MMRIALALLALAGVFTVVGCGKKAPEFKEDMPIKTTAGGMEKGKQKKTMEASLEDPGPRK